ncbi:Retrotransposable element Tf2 protein [Rhizoctonia solani]|uniref:Retrotransposable element Tf2 protein n=1 Tax=Rhizoctonia solani TaxID=456999 RepID=A0A8H8P763_9AGAM|nr:Retrotransposable element Tf2 protein [Rhizoctonia solani]QRW26435.1 Retrotransposable element Tf2 protein [Rhizoctonia solani]
MLWLKKHNPQISWEKHTLVFNLSYCSNNCLSTPAVLELKAVEEIPLPYQEFHKVFSKEELSKLPPHCPYDIAIELLPDAKPWHGPIYSLGPREDAELKETIEKQLKAGLICPSKSPMASPILFVKKKNGKLCMCVDYQRLNSMTKKNVYPLPLPQNLIEKLQGAKIFSKFDLKAGYTLVQIKEGDKWKTAFKTKYRLFEYLVMPFGLTNAPAAFQDMMNEIFRDLLDVYVIIYLDNILVFSLNEKDHKAHVQEILKRLQDNDLFCNIKKCHFHVKRIDYLGFIILEFGIEVDQSKVTDAMNWSTPKNVKNIQEFLGFKDSVWRWDLAEQQSFDGLKKCLTTAPLLLQPDTTKQFYVECNASDYATGAILSQRNSEGKLAPVAYLSKLLSPAEKNYDIFDKELLAVIRAFKEWCHLLEGSESPVQVLTDHKNLEYFSTSQSLNKRQIRWANFLVDYNFQIIYRPGAQNKKANILLRRYNLVPLEGGVENQVLLKPELFIASITPDQEINDLIGKAIYEDDRLKEILHKLQNKEKVLEWELKEGLLWYQGKIFVPKDNTIRNLILESRHDALAAGHPGQARTLELISRSYYWPLLKKFVNSYVSHCKTCIRSKPTNQLPVGLLKPLQIPERPWEDIAYDMIVGLPVSEGFDAILTKEAKIFIRMFGNHCQSDWVSLLPLAKFALNNLKQSSTRKSLFQICYGLNPQFSVGQKTDELVPNADEHAEFLEKGYDKVKATLSLSQERMKYFYNQRHREEEEIQVGNKVWLSHQNISTDRPSIKLSHKKLGPYLVIEKIGTHAYKLQLPHTMRIHPVFHINLLTKFHPNPHGHDPPQPAPIITEEGEEEYEVERIIDSKWKGRGKSRKLWYLVKWRGYNEGSNLWEPIDNVDNAQEAIKEFHDEHPDASIGDRATDFKPTCIIGPSLVVTTNITGELIELRAICKETVDLLGDKDQGGTQIQAQPGPLTGPTTPPTHTGGEANTPGTVRPGLKAPFRPSRGTGFDSKDKEEPRHPKKEPQGTPRRHLGSLTPFDAGSSVKRPKMDLPDPYKGDTRGQKATQWLD